MIFHRGAPHCHLCLYLVDENGDSAPSLWLSSNEDLADENFEEQKRRIEEINEELISASLEDAKCLDHSDGFSSSCDACRQMHEYVSTFQFHRCTTSCRKKKKVVHVLGSQGLGVHEEESCDIIWLVCRYKFPKFPMYKTVLLFPISKNEDPKKVHQVKKDLKHIIAYLIRRASFIDSKENEHLWLKFKNMSFDEFLLDVGMYESLASSLSPEEKREQAIKRYVNALRASINGSGYVFLKRNPEDIFINHFNTLIMSIVKCNHDIQYIFDEFSCTNYMTAYVTKIEAGWSLFLKRLEEEIRNLTKIAQLERLGSEVDKKREVSIQEAIYRALGLPMSKFSTKVKFISTNHPIKRDGLLRENWQEIEDGEPILHLSQHQYYELRPQELSDLCLADFIANYEVGQREKSNGIQLTNNKGYIYPRGKPAVLRYFINYDEPEEFARGLLILFYPFNNEMADIHDQDVMELLDENKDMIEEKRKSYEKNVNLVSLIKEIEKIQEEKGGESNDENEEEEEDIAEDDEFETTSEEDITKFINSMKAAARKDVKSNSDSTIPTIMDLREKIILLNQNQRMIFDDITERIFSLNADAEQFCVYIAGAAGTGVFFS